MEKVTSTEPTFSQSITSLPAEIGNPDFDVVNSDFNLEFNDDVLVKSFKD